MPGRLVCRRMANRTNRGAAFHRGNYILKLLESGKFNSSELGKGLYQEKIQPSLFDPKESEVEKQIKEIDLDNLTPLDALNLLKELKEELE